MGTDDSQELGTSLGGSKTMKNSRERTTTTKRTTKRATEKEMGI
jgi:hypothetical protein